MNNTLPTGQSDTQVKAESFKEKALDFVKGMPKRYFITAFSGMAIGLFCTLIAGTIIGQLSKIFGNSSIAVFLNNIAIFAKVLMGAGIGLGIAHSLKAPKMVLSSCAVVGFTGAFATIFIKGNFADFSGVFTIGKPGDPITSYVCTIIACEFGLLVSGKTKVDILVVPLTVLIVGGFTAYFLGKPVSSLMTLIGNGISAATKEQPFIMGIIVAVSMGLLLTFPTSSAAIGVAIGLSGIAAGAAVAGCCAQMVGFAVASFRENKYGGLIAQGLGTSMLQIPNIGRNFKILIPPVIASAICGPISSCLFMLEASKIGSGMGTAGLVGIIDSVSVSLETLPVWQVITGVSLTYLILPAVISFIVSEFMRKKNMIKFGDMKLDI